MFVGPAHAGSGTYDAFWERLKTGEFVADKFCRIGKGVAKSGFSVLPSDPSPDGRSVKVVEFVTDLTEEGCLRETLVDGRRRCREGGRVD